MSFFESPRFPEGISYGSSGGPGFKTHIFEGHTAIEQRNQVWQLARGKWDVSHGVKDKDDMDALRAFFINARGRAHGFRFKDWSDYQIVDQQLGVGDGVNRVFPIIKTYAGANPYTRRIYKPVASTVVVRVNGVLSALSGDYALNAATGVITFNNNGTDIPELGEVVTVSCEFDVPVRFDTDQMNASHEGWLVESWSSIPIVELLEEDQL